MTIGELCNRDVVITSPDASVREAARLMREHHVGDLVVVERSNGNPEPVGILTDRDLVIEVMATGADDRAVRVSEAMTAELVTARESEDPADVLRRMRSFGVRRMPVVDEIGGLIGIIAVDDLLEWMSEQLRDVLALIQAEQRRERDRF